ncbi:hypothetical protein HY480_03510 [Candidatus Uhrbacteria bacterium]|nr:hypothetical protein [Candidatus Uhrbacteria bacterium]
MQISSSTIFAAALVCAGCVSARYSTTPSSRLTDDCGEFVAESGTSGVAVSEAVQNFGNACRDIQMAGADAAYIQSLEATARWYAEQDMHVEDFASAPELVGEDLATTLGPQHPRVGIQSTTCIKPATRAQCRVVTQRLIATFRKVVPVTVAHLDATHVLVITVGPSGHTSTPYAITGAVIDTRDGSTAGNIPATSTRLYAP